MQVRHADLRVLVKAVVRKRWQVGEHWAGHLTGQKNPPIDDVMIVPCDGCPRLAEAIEAIWPNQRCRPRRAPFPEGDEVEVVDPADPVEGDQVIWLSLGSPWGSGLLDVEFLQKCAAPAGDSYAGVESKPRTANRPHRAATGSVAKFSRCVLHDDLDQGAHSWSTHRPSAARS